MIEMTNDEIKNTCLKIMKEFDNLCRDNNLRYSIAYGTLIGAIRHGGFIPWDDDIDVVMPRSDYDKLLELNYTSEQFEIKNYKKTKGYYYSFTKMIDKTTYIDEYYRREKDMGVFIDIFPMDFFDYEENELKKLVKNTRNIKKLLDCIGSNGKRDYSKSIFRWIAKKILSVIIFPFKKMILVNVENMFRSGEGKYCSCLIYDGCGIKNVFETDMWDNLIEVKFEGLNVFAFSQYHSRLTKIYGDYMKLPPKEQRVTNHNFNAYYR